MNVENMMSLHKIRSNRAQPLNICITHTECGLPAQFTMHPALATYFSFRPFLVYSDPRAQVSTPVACAILMVLAVLLFC